MMQIAKKQNSHIKFKADFVYLFVFLSFFALVIYALTILSPIFSRSARDGMEFCFSVIIPSIFPFMILADLIIYTVRFEKITVLKRLFSKLFKINSSALSVYLTGLISGFPLGAKLARELYGCGKISKNECERLIAISNNASPAFVICGIGFSLFGSLKLGVFLYLISVVSSLLSGIIFSLPEKASQDLECESKHSFSLVDSIKSATSASIAICGFIVFFTIAGNLIFDFVKNDTIDAIIAAILEIGNASQLISTLNTSLLIKIPLLSFAISFSGISVHFQTKSLLCGTDLSMKKYYIMKLFSGILSYLISFFLILFLF